MKQAGFGAILWLLSVEFLLAQFGAQTGLATTLAETDLSQLGVSTCPPAGPGNLDCSPLHWLFNLGAILNGILVLAGIWLTRSIWPISPLTNTALWLLAIGGGVGIMIVGLFPIDVSASLHLSGAMLALFVPCFGMAVLAGLHWPTHRGFALYSAATAVISLSVLILYAMEIYLGLGRGTMERIMAWPHTLWYPVTGALILLGYFRPEPAEPSGG